MARAKQVLERFPDLPTLRRAVEEAKEEAPAAAVEAEEWIERCVTAEADSEGARQRRDALRAAREDARRAEEEARLRAEVAVEEIERTLSSTLERAKAAAEEDLNALDVG
eukprot:1513124-Prymnesium_polylepis.1